MFAKKSRWNELRRQLLKTILLLGALLFVATNVSPAAAAGRIIWKKTTIKENTKRESWKLEMEIHLPKPPDVAFLPMRFEFKPTAHYERSLVDGREGPVERTVPLTNNQSIIESVDVGFMDAGTGVTQSRTRFSFKVTRAHDFVAGEYQVTIKDGRTGRTIGVPTTLRFTGENPVIDRRSIVFAGKEKTDKKDEAKEQSPAEEAPAAEESETEEYEEPEEGNQPPSVDERPGGGCHHSPADTIPVGWPLGALLGAVALWLRRKAAQR